MNKLTMIMTFLLTLSSVGAVDFSSLAIQLNPGKNQQFVLGNKGAGFWMGHSGNKQVSGFDGWTCYEYRYIKEIKLTHGAHAEILDPSLVTLFPDRVERKFPVGNTIFYFVDNYDAIIQEYRIKQSDADLSTEILFHNDYRIINTSKNYIILEFESTTSLQPSYMMIGIVDETSNILETVFTQKGDKLEIKLPDKEGKYDLIVALEHTKELAIELFNQIAAKTDVFKSQRRFRLKALFDQNPFKSANKQLEKAWFWNLIAMDDLVSRQMGPGIFAGYPWFNNYWGRDTFISLPGALLITGKWDVAAEILSHFGNYQIRDAKKKEDGRIPNRIMLNEVIYNTADGTPWYFYALQRYVDYTGDTSIMDSLYESLAYFINANIERHTDSLGFILHDDADTWMDAKGTKGPWSPRGDRAVEIQLLWMQNIKSGLYWSSVYNDMPNTKKWKSFYHQLKVNFYHYFVKNDSLGLADHLNKDGTQDEKIRPNMIFGPFLEDSFELHQELKHTIADQVVGHLVYPYGVATLPQFDKDFHPYHEYEPYYVKDEAYHNGLIWCWLNGPVKSVLGRSGYWNHFYELLKNENQQILNKNGIGAFSELLEPIPRNESNDVRYSGTISQAWSSAEYLRTFQEDLSGIYPNFLSGDTIIILAKELPAEWLPFEKEVRIRGESYRILQLGNRQKQMIHIVSNKPLNKTFIVKAYMSNNIYVKSFDITNRNLDCTVYFKNTQPELMLGKTPLKWQQKLLIDPIASFTQPDLTIKWPTIYNRITHQLLSPDEVLSGSAFISEPDMVLKMESDGRSAGYGYPENPAFKQGIAELKTFQMKEGDKFIAFDVRLKKLTNPGWRPQSGFQLTFLTIAIWKNKRKNEKKMIEIRFNSNFSVNASEYPDRLILVGNGIELYDKNLNILAAYIPPQEGGQFGDVSDAAIRFRLPKDLLPGTPDDWQILVLCGVQDDHGGGGIGEFRAVKSQSGEWHGGGFNPDFGNVYTILTNIDGIFE